MTKEENEFLQFIYNRLNLVYNENVNYDYMIKFKKIIDKSSEETNVWIRIECENDFPKDSFNYWLMCNDDRVINIKDFDYYKRHLVPNLIATHYQPMKKPKPPIY